MSGDSGILNFVPSIKVIRVKFLLQYYAIPKKWIGLIPFLFKTLKWKQLWQRLDDGNKLEEEQDLGNMVRLPGWKLQGALLYIRVMSLQPARSVPHLILMERQPWQNVLNQWRRHAKYMFSLWLISLGRFLRSVRPFKKRKNNSNINPKPRFMARSCTSFAIYLWFYFVAGLTQFLSLFGNWCLCTH